MVNITIYFVFLNMAAFLLRQTICSLVTTLIEESNLLKPFVFFWLIKSNIQKTSLFFVEITNVLPLTVSTVFMMNVSIRNFCFVLNLPTTKLFFGISDLIINLPEYQHTYFAFYVLTIFLCFFRQTTIQC